MKLVKELFVKKRVIIDCANNNIKKYIDIYNGKFNIFESVYCFNDDISIDNVIVDKIFLDFDYDDDGVFFDDAKKIAKYFMDQEIKFYIRFSGRGFHIFPFVERDNKNIDYRNAIRNYVYELHKENNTSSDNAVVGDLRRLRRVLHTINPKSNLYCIPLSYDDLQTKTYNEIKKYAKKDKGSKDIIYNTKCISLSEYDYFNMDFDVDIDIGGDNITNIDDDIPPCIRSFLSDPELGYKERTDLIIYLRDMGYTYNDIVGILEEHLSPEKFNHCMSEEKQVERIMQKDMLLMRNCKTLKLFGLCPSQKCNGNNLYL